MSLSIVSYLHCAVDSKVKILSPSLFSEDQTSHPHLSTLRLGHVHVSV